jgi:uncharacterized protein YutE (UPF0331/DUF86 family)
MTLLEDTLRRRFEGSPSISQSTDMRRPISLRFLMDVAARQQLIEPADSRKLQEWVNVRNAVVHTARPVNSKLAREIVEGVYRITEILRLK